ncbi:MAG: glycerol-3-phosphate dehydrogenase/oxidase [Dehalococcoidia bacterium]|jgi:glycerol-3-phosphate dehydrogenase
MGRLREETFDLVIVGGGITGAAIARDAAMRGLSVALLEKGDFASGTSSKSSKMVHGGLRYLKGRHIRLVRESLRERGVLLKIAPHLVRADGFYLPVYEGDRDGRLMLKLGLTAYDVLAGFGDITHHRMLSKEQLLEAEPLLRPEGLRGGFRYSDALVDDARLTLTTVRSAVKKGAVTLNYMEATALQRDDGRVTGVTFADRMTGQSGAVAARVVVNATGPWVDRVRELGGAPPILRPSKGIHLVLPASRLNLSKTIVIPRNDRILLAVPTGDCTYVGTTDSDYPGDPGAVTVDADDAAYVLDAANALFPSPQLLASDVIAGWAGVRPLVAKEGTPTTSDVSRDFEIDSGPEGLVSIAGGKLTTCRAMAEKLVDSVIARDGQRFGWKTKPCRTEETPLAGGIMDGFESYSRSARTVLEESWGLPPTVAERLLHTHGTEHVKVLAYALRDPRLLHPLADGCPVLRAEALYAVEEEMALTLEDFMARRTELMLFGAGNGLAAAGAAADLMGSALGWSGRERRRQVEQYRAVVAGMTAFATAKRETPAPAESD